MELFEAALDLPVALVDVVDRRIGALRAVERLLERVPLDRLARAVQVRDGALQVDPDVRRGDELLTRPRDQADDGSAPSARASRRKREKSAIFPSRERWSDFSDSARLCRRALFAFSKSRFATSPRARSIRVEGFVVSAPSSCAVRRRSSASRMSLFTADVRSSLIVSRPSCVKSSALWKSLFSIALLARDRRSSIGATSRLMALPERMSAWPLENEEERCSWRIFSERFHAFFARSIAVVRSSDASAPSAFARPACVSPRSAPSPLARAASAELESTIARARSR